MSLGSLTIVGTGIQFGAHITAETRAYIEDAEKLYYVVTHPLVSQWVKEMNPNAESLAPFYRQHERRIDAYNAMTEHVLAAVRDGWRVCAVFYGHPGVYVAPSHWLVRRGRAEGFKVRMLAGISAEDCLVADLGIDPATHGCQSFEATDFLIRQRLFEPTSTLILWQIGGLGNPRSGRNVQPEHLSVMVDHLTKAYPPNHQVIIYEAARLPLKPRIDRFPLNKLPDARLTPLSTLVILPTHRKPLDDEMLAKLDMSLSDLRFSQTTQSSS